MAEVMSCRDAVHRLWAFLDGDLDEEEHNFVEEHLAFCLRCCRELSMTEELRTTLSSGATAEMPDEVRQRLETFIDGLDPSCER